MAEGSNLGVGAVDGLLARGEVVPAAAVGHEDGAASALIALVSPARDAGVRQDVDDAVGAGGLDVVHGTGRAAKPTAACRTGWR
jgi:hypothetical protein